MVHGILRDHDVVMEVVSAPGEGSTFSVYFPAVSGVASPSAVPVSQQGRTTRTEAPKGAHLLYVDDDEMIAFLMERLLQRRGCRVTVFTHAAQALAAVLDHAEPFDLVITDCNMPGMSGLDFARAVRELNPDSTVAITSGYISEELFAAVDRLARARSHHRAQADGQGTSRWAEFCVRLARRWPSRDSSSQSRCSMRAVTTAR